MYIYIYIYIFLYIHTYLQYTHTHTRSFDDGMPGKATYAHCSRKMICNVGPVTGLIGGGVPHPAVTSRRRRGLRCTFLLICGLVLMRGPNHFPDLVQLLAGELVRLSVLRLWALPALARSSRSLAKQMSSTGSQLCLSKSAVKSFSSMTSPLLCRFRTNPSDRHCNWSFVKFF